MVCASGLCARMEVCGGADCRRTFGSGCTGGDGSGIFARSRPFGSVPRIYLVSQSGSPGTAYGIRVRMSACALGAASPRGACPMGKLQGGAQPGRCGNASAAGMVALPSCRSHVGDRGGGAIYGKGRTSAGKPDAGTACMGKDTEQQEQQEAARKMVGSIR